MSNDLKVKAAELRKQVEDNGWEVRDNGQHPVALGGKAIVTIPSTPSDHRAIANLKGQLRRAGYLDPKNGVTPADQKAARRAKGKRVAPSQTLRKELKSILEELGESPEYADPSHKGQRGGARAKLIPLVKEAYEECGIEPPTSDGGYYNRIKAWLAGDKTYQDHITVLATLVAKHRKSETTVTTGGFQDIVPGKGLITKWRCPDCAQVYETREMMAIHRLEAHDDASAANAVMDGKLIAQVHDAIDATVAPLPSLMDDLSVRVLVAILDPQTGRDEALALAEEVRRLS